MEAFFNKNYPVIIALVMACGISAVGGGYYDGSEYDASIFALFHLNESEGATTFIDSSYTSNDGGCVTTECPSMGSPGIFGSAAQFDGPNNFITVPDTAVFDGMSKLTMQVWMYPTTLDGQPRGIVSRRVNSGSEQAYSIFMHTGNQLNVDINKQAGSERFQIDWTFVVNRWYHVVVVFDGTQASNADKIKVYVNGVADGSNATSTSSYTAIGSYASDLHIGTLNSGYAQHFVGLIDDVILYDDALPEDYIRSQYLRGRWRHLHENETCQGQYCDWASWWPGFPKWVSWMFRGLGLRRVS